ncbi:hypothetical protein M758_3G071600 [Ceratodon purpureus]|uniref:Fungal lipase-type domain-containing protein n=1 Tax=Ceratodon purpureus TaxID=3225 RepID=A0A8T0IHU5_CERPU|nr:hypothetical protein KC19_3G071200 [Ceratodon purpureus]KAG0622092.1 hypothetical protein M758_3G071600 [Ceratodon purpureus]KAG0622093.1 hypothetical protein M758_3G071600 [Ceratodon purpureus]KAG0622094.1 hypothetical protein M758_3G071600 [Ceratodon purpureus]
MEDSAWRRLFFLGAFLLLLSCATIPRGRLGVHKHEALYNRTKALALVEYASAVYIVDDASLLAWNCSRCQGVNKDFKIHTLIVDVQHCLQAFVGVAENLNSVVVAFRGTQKTSMQNWVEDLYFKELDLNYPGVTDAMVHRGFYAAYHNTTLREQVVTAVQRIQQDRSELRVTITGHSMGGAMAAFCALDLTANYGVKDIEVYTFGQPRLGNAAFAAFYIATVPRTIRVTHEHDLVVHLPPYYPRMGQKTYHHFPNEVWLIKVSVDRMHYEFEQMCDSTGEDIYCSRSVLGNSVADHLNYYGVYLRTVDNVLALNSDSANSNSSLASQALGYCRTTSS